MKDKYYIVQEHLHPDLRESHHSLFHGLTFVRVSQNELEYIAGESILLGLLEFVNGELRMNNRAVCKYSIFPMGRKKFNISKDRYLERLRQESSRRRIHSAR